MGYTTDFTGSFEISPTLTPEQVAYLQAFNGTRRMKRNSALVAALTDTRREAVGLPVGTDGGYYVGSVDDGNFGQGKNFGERDADIIDYNDPPTGQPGLWCQWAVSDDGTRIEWDGGEKFYSYVEWLRYLVENFLKPWGRKLNGKVHFQGEERGDYGDIIVSDNAIR